jgi:hypothetical protein
MATRLLNAERNGCSEKIRGTHQTLTVETSQGCSMP